MPEHLPRSPSCLREGPGKGSRRSLSMYPMSGCRAVGPGGHPPCSSAGTCHPAQGSAGLGLVWSGMGSLHQGSVQGAGHCSHGCCCSRRHDQIFLSRISHGSLELSPSQTSQIEAPQEPLRGSMGVLGYRWLPILPSRGWASEPPSGSGLACNLLGPIKSDGRDVWELWKLGPMVPCSFHLL